MLPLKATGKGRWIGTRSSMIHLAVAGLISVAAIYIRFDRFGHREFPWGDERPQMEALRQSVFGMMEFGLDDVQFPGDYLLLWPFHRLFGENRWALAFPHIVTTVLGFYLLYAMCSRYFKTVWGYVATFLIMALNNNLIYHAFEIRPYGVLVTLSIASFLVMRSIVETKNAPLGQKIAVSLFIIGTVFFHFYGAFILFFTYLYHFWSCRKEERSLSLLFRNMRDYGVAGLVAMLVLCFFVFNYDKGYLVIYGTFKFIPKGIVPVTKAIVGNLVGSKKLYFLLAGLVAGFLVPHKDRRLQLIFLLVLVAAPIGLIFLSCLISNYFFVQRLFIWVMPLFAFLVGWQWDSLIDWGWRQWKVRRGLVGSLREA